jgi:hypothetical protein
MQLGVPLTVLHSTPQPPQLSASFVVSIQSLLQHFLEPEQSFPASRSHPMTHSPDGLHWSAPTQSAIVRQATHW